MDQDIIIIGIAGGSGSGKTTFARRLLDALGKENCSILGQDSYYIDQSHRFDKDGGAVNFDHPDSLDFPLMAEHFKQLKKGQDIEVPVYDFATHTRGSKANSLEVKKYILVDGILLFSQDIVLPHLDIKIYIDCPEELRFQRRLDRDVRERGRTPEGVKEQFLKQVKPMHDQFVETSKKLSDDIVNVENFDEKVQLWSKKITST